ncbi:3-isopropylmalate dehydratase small subunit [Rhodobacteraceae bacterium 2CG4]|uniref:3-isopropylmalate dehydratase small subunit n=1 Tax=Halovulum marinum TaxID=2662447 RepID=A0A6L5Z3N3_9RHOB|nr:3-isopropylmalate dehydratase small subunit [Halovulum marinum]MSU90909.1 3-isopropylmalate dehydratase small subunit [Halovulum marinum]
MKSFTTHDGVALPLMTDNMNTDVIIPSREMKRVSKAGLADGLFANFRYADGKREPAPGFLLNQPDYAKASVLMLGRNAGCGSSREHAVWALADYGFRVVIAETIASIFHDNCVANGILPVALPRAALDRIAAWTSDDPQGRRVRTDLKTCRVEAAGAAYDFEIAPLARRMLLKGLSPIDLTLQDISLIETFSKTDRQCRGWLYRAGES